MIKLPAFIFVLVLSACAASKDKSPLVVKTLLPKELKEISGIAADGADIWAITDKPRAEIYRLDQSGKLKQKITITNIEATDVEAVTADRDYIYIGDVGDNTGDRVERRIIKVAKANINSGKATGEVINFTFPGEGEVTKKKENNFDCESIISFRDSLYVFTKDREDKETSLYTIPKVPGQYSARFISSFDAKGLITDAAINPANNELALIGYHKGHRYPFILTFNNFISNDFFSGKHERVNLADQPWDWQLEGITYGNNNTLYFACEGTKQVDATFYGIKRNDLDKIEKRKKENSNTEANEPIGLTKKGHLKMQYNQKF